MTVRRFAWILVWLGGLSALAAMFGPDLDAVDVGAIGTNVFMLTLMATIGLLAARGTDVFPDYMSIAERRAWVGLVFVAVILASFVRHVWALMGSVVPEHIHGLLGQQFIHRLFVLIIAWAVISHLIGRGAGALTADERDLRMRHGADRAGDWALTLIVIAGISVLASVPASSLAWWLAPMVLANLLVGLLIAKALVEHVALAFAYAAARA